MSRRAKRSHAPLDASAIMQTSLLTCSPATPVREAAARMAERRFSAILVTQADRAQGLWTERDSLALAATSPERVDRPIGEVMSPIPMTVKGRYPVKALAADFKHRGIRHCLVVDDRDAPIGMISQTDLALKQGIEPYLRLRDVQSTMRPLPSILPGHLKLQDAARFMLEQQQDATVIDCGGGRYGILTERDVLRLAARHGQEDTIDTLASQPLHTLSLTSTLIEARNAFIDLRLRHLAVMDEHQQVVGLLGFRDILEQTEDVHHAQIRELLEERDSAHSRSRLSLQLAEKVIASSLEGIIITDAQARIEFVNPAFTQLTGYTLEEVSGRTPALLSSGRHDAAFYSEMWHNIRRHGSWRGEIWNRRKSGQLFLELLTIYAIYDDGGDVTHYAALFTDITHIRENEERVRRMAYYDPLTQLPNRRLLEDRLDLAIRHAHRQQQQLGVVFIDLDHFKQVNDTLGHAAGDALLLEVAHRLRSVLREDDTLARLGGDEFIALLPELNEASEARKIAARLIDSISGPFFVDGQQFRIGCSLGISLYPDDGDSVDMLVQHADAAMYRAKQEGRNTYRFFHQQHRDVGELQPLTLESALRDAADSGSGLAVHYQPLVNRDSGRLEGAEALLRWHHPELGHVSPGTFIPVAERSGLMIALGDWMMETVARQLGEWNAAGHRELRVAVNLSARQFWHRSLVEQVSDLYRRYRLSPGQLGFEITESLLLDKQQPASAIIRDLRRLGCRVALDDFGTGYSSLSYLQALPVTTIKIDRRFIQGLGQRRSNAIVAAVTSLARELDISVVAEGVETQAQREALARYPVTLLQGFLIGRPLPADAFTRTWLSQPYQAPDGR